MPVEQSLMSGAEFTFDTINTTLLFMSLTVFNFFLNQDVKPSFMLPS